MIQRVNNKVIDWGRSVNIGGVMNISIVALMLCFVFSACSGELNEDRDGNPNGGSKGGNGNVLNEKMIRIWFAQDYHGPFSDECSVAIKKFLERLADFTAHEVNDVLTASGHNLLAEALHSGMPVEVIEALLEKGVEVEWSFHYPDIDVSYGYIHYMGIGLKESRNEEWGQNVVQAFLNYGVPLNDPSPRKRNIFCLFVYRWCGWQGVNTKDASCPQKDERSLRALGEIVSMLGRKKVEGMISDPYDDGEYIIHKAVRSSSPRFVQYLVDNDFMCVRQRAVDQFDPKRFVEPLEVAFSMRDADMCLALLDLGASMEVMPDVDFIKEWFSENLGIEDWEYDREFGSTEDY